MKISARNQFKGTVIDLKPGAVNTVDKVEIAPKVIVSSVVTQNAIEELGIEKGKEAFVIIKASSVMLGVDEA